MWLAEVQAKAKRRTQILFAAESLLLAELRRLIAGANRRALILWALELAEETVQELEAGIPMITVPGRQQRRPGHGLPERSKCLWPDGRSWLAMPWPRN